MMTYAEKIHCAQLYCEDCIRVEECVSKFECGQTCNCCHYQLLSEKFQSIEKKEEAEIQRWLFKDLNDYSEVKRRNPMTRLDRVLKLLEEYDALAEATLCDILDCEDTIRSFACLTSLRAEKQKLTRELIEHGCRRKN